MLDQIDHTGAARKEIMNQLTKLDTDIAISKNGMLDLNTRKEASTLPVTPFIVIPRDKLHKVLTQSNSSLGIKDT